jgi:hypothetical protein
LQDSTTQIIDRPPRDSKRSSVATFEDFAKQRKLLQEFCNLHVPSVEFFACRSFPIFKLDDDETEPNKFRHITSSATCFASIECCPNKFRPEKKKDSKDFESLGAVFARKAIDLPVNSWKSDGAAGIYCSSRGLPYVLSKLDTWHPKIEDHLKRIFYQMEVEHERFAVGEADRADKEEEKADETKSWYKPNAYHTYWALELLRTLGKYEDQKDFVASKEVPKALARRPQLRQWARQQLGFQVALHSADSSVLDSDQLAWSLAISVSQPETYQSNLAEQDFIRQAFRCLFSTQERVGTWRHYGPLFHYPHAGNAYCYVFETFAVLLTEALKPKAEFVRNILKDYFSELMRLWQYATSTQTMRPRGELAWSSGHRNKQNLESWATASVFAYAQALRRLVGTWTRGEALSSLNYKATFPTKKKAEEKLVERAAIWSRPDLADRLWTMFINTVGSKDPQEGMDPDEPLIREDFPCSAILFGPPGTSKTSLVTAVAGAIGWNYVELHPSHFVAEGLPSVQHTADVIFRKLMELDHTVVLFDEIDELVREREIEPDQFGRFLTTSMLPRLAELWRGRKVMFFVATNHIEYFDRAVTRSERFDAIIFMSPPAFDAKVKKLFRVLKDTYDLEASLSSEVSKESIEAAMPMECCKAAEKAPDRAKRDLIRAQALPSKCTLSKFALLRWDELDELALHVWAVMGKKKVLTRRVLEEALARIKDDKTRSVGEYCRFRSNQQDYEHFDTSRNGRWIVKEIVGAGKHTKLPGPVKEQKGVRYIDVPVGRSVDNVRMADYIVERIPHEGKLAPGQVRLRKSH